MLGGALLDLLLAEGHEVRCLVREESPNESRLIGLREPERLGRIARRYAQDDPEANKSAPIHRSPPG